MTRSITAIANGLDQGGVPDPKVVEAIQQEQGSKKFLILDALHRNGKAQTVQDLIHWTKGLDHGLNAHEITRLLWALQKMGYVRFTERHAGSSTELIKINLTPLAVRDLWPDERRAKARVEKVNRPHKPQVVPSPEYVVPEPARYAAPEPPAQNAKSSTDVESGSKEPQGMTVATQGTTDTHTQYLKTMAIPYKNSPGTATSRQRTLRFLRDVIAAIPASGKGNWVGYSELRATMGMKSGNISVLVRSAAEFNYVDMLSHTGSTATSFRILDRGRQDIEAFADVLDVKLGQGNFGKKKPAPVKEPFRGHAPQDQSITDLEEQEAIDQGFSATHTVKPMEVVARDEADAEKKETLVTPGEIYQPPRDKPDLTDYPLLVELMGKEKRGARYVRAAEILAEEPDDDSADVVLGLLEKVQISELEKEMLRFIRQVISS